MRTQYLFLTALLSFNVNAEIFKCKDTKGKIAYQSIPCSTGSVGVVRKDADVSESDRVRAQERIDGVFERERQRNAAAERERVAQQESARKFQLEEEIRANEKKKIELLERQVLATEQNAIASQQAAAAANRARIAAERAERAVNFDR